MKRRQKKTCRSWNSEPRDIDFDLIAEIQLELGPSNEYMGLSSLKLKSVDGISVWTTQLAGAGYLRIS